MKSKAVASVILLAVVLQGSSAFGWWSAYTGTVDSTHFKIAQQAYLMIGDDYPDIITYRDRGPGLEGGLEGWMSGPTDDVNAHGKKYEMEYNVEAQDFNGGPILAWWGNDPSYPEDGVLVKYKQFNFSDGEYSAYYYLALMAHIISDHGVPAHAANVFHNQPYQPTNFEETYGDNLESYAYWVNFPEDSYTINELPGNYPPDYYLNTDSGAISVTKKKLERWVDPDNHTPYWVPSQNYIGQMFESNWGHYGLATSEGFQDTYSSVKDKYGIIPEQLDQSVSLISGFLRTASRALPPLVKDLSITTQDDEPQFAGTIAFELLENRTSQVTVNIRAVSTQEGGDTYVVSAGGQTWKDVAVDLTRGEDLPWGIDRTLTWSGAGWSEKTGKFVYLPNGEYWLKLEVQDGDGNEVNAVYSTINNDGIPQNDTAKKFNVRTSAPAAPTAFIASGYDASVKLAWTAPTTDSSGNDLGSFAGFRLYRRDEQGSPCGASDAEFNGVTYCQLAAEAQLPQATRTYQDKDVVVGTTYTYVLQAVNNAGTGSPPAEPVSARPFKALWVPGEYSSITAALEAAGNGDVVMVRQGTYRESELNIGRQASLITTPATNVILMSERGPAGTTIDGSAGGVIINATDGSAVIGFTIRGGVAESTAVKCYFDNNVLVANNVFVSNGTGIYSGSTTRTRIYNNTFAANETGSYSSFYGGVDVRNNIFVDNAVALDIDEAAGRAWVLYNDFSGNGIDLIRTTYRTDPDAAEDVRESYDFDPEFVSYNTASPWLSDFKLRSGSPAIDKGDPELALLSSNHGWLSRDLPWIDADGTRADLGAYGGPYPGTWANDDHDADGVSDSLDPDDDNDCLADSDEDENGNSIFELALGETNPLDADTDDDGLTDGNCGSEDLNANGVWEPELGETDPRNADSDGDGIQDGTEKGLTTPESLDTDIAMFVADADSLTTTDPLNPDSDGDGLDDGVEDANHSGSVDAAETDPGNADSDDDGYPDGEEAAQGSEPLDPLSVPNHPPTVLITAAVQRTDGSGLAEVTFTGADQEGDDCSLAIAEVSTDGLSWTTVPVRESDLRNTVQDSMPFDAAGSTYTLVWDAHAVLGEVETGGALLRLRAFDGHLSGATVESQPFVVDTVPPRIMIDVPVLANHAVTPAITTADGQNSSVSATLDGEIWSGGAVSTEGHHTLQATASDACGNTATTAAEFTIDLVPPTISFDGVVDGGIYDTGVTVTWHVTDGLDGYPTTTATCANPQAFAFSGRYSIQVAASDAAGNTTSRSCSFGIYALADLPVILGDMTIDSGLKGSLLAKVRNAIEARERGNPDAAVNLLEAFIDAVQAQSGKKITAADARTLIDFASEVISLLRNSWDQLDLGEVFVAGDDPALTTPAALVATLEANAVRRIVLEAYRAEAAGVGTILDDLTIAALLVEAERSGIGVTAGMESLAGGIDPADQSHRSHLAEAAVGLLSRHPGLAGVCLTGLEAPHLAQEVTELAETLKEAVGTLPGRTLSILVGCPGNDAERTHLLERKGLDIQALGAVADTLYLDTEANADADGDGEWDSEPSWPADAVSYAAGLGLPADLVVLLPTSDLMEPFEDADGDGIRDELEPFTDLDGDGSWGIDIPLAPGRLSATISGLPADLIRGIAVHRFGDTGADEWSAILGSHPR